MKKILCIGGASLDYIATPDKKLKYAVSNNGVLNVSFGGVSHNICYNLSLLGHKMTFITALGDDTAGELIHKHLKENNITCYTPKSALPTCSYVAINESDHDMAVAIFDNRIVSDINEKYLKSQDALIKKFDYIVMCGNLSQAAIDYIAKTYSKTHKLFCDAISPHLVTRYFHVLDKIYLLKCNIHEAHSVAGNNKLKDEALVKALFKKGLKNVIVSNNKYPIYYGLNGKDIYCYKIKPHTKFVNTTGCGDALMSGVIHYLSLGKSFEQAIHFGHQLSDIIIMAKGATTPEIKKFAVKK